MSELCYFRHIIWMKSVLSQKFFSEILKLLLLRHPKACLSLLQNRNCVGRTLAALLRTARQFLVRVRIDARFPASVGLASPEMVATAAWSALARKSAADIMRLASLSTAAWWAMSFIFMRRKGKFILQKNGSYITLGGTSILSFENVVGLPCAKISMRAIVPKNICNCVVDIRFTHTSHISSLQTRLSFVSQFQTVLV